MKWLTKYEHENYPFFQKYMYKIITSKKKTIKFHAADLISLWYIQIYLINLMNAFYTMV